jgi:hypothetical protein
VSTWDILTYGEVESFVQLEGLELLRRMIQGYFDPRSAEEPIREHVVGEDGRSPGPIVVKTAAGAWRPASGR